MKKLNIKTEPSFKAPYKKEYLYLKQIERRPYFKIKKYGKTLRIICYNILKDINMKKNSNECKKSPKLTVPEIIDYCKNILGITFNLMDEEKAKTFLEKNNFFFRLK